MWGGAESSGLVPITRGAPRGSRQASAQMLSMGGTKSAERLGRCSGPWAGVEGHSSAVLCSSAEFQPGAGDSETGLRPGSRGRLLCTGAGRGLLCPSCVPLSGLKVKQAAELSSCVFKLCSLSSRSSALEGSLRDKSRAVGQGCPENPVSKTA